MVDVDTNSPTSPRHGSSAIAGVLTAAVLTCWSSNVAAQELPHFELAWESPAACPEQSEVDEQIRSLLSAAPGSALPSHLRAKGLIEPTGERFQLTLSIQIGPTRGVRIIQSDECVSLGKAAAVVLGLLIRKEQDLGRELSHADLGNDFQTSTKPAEPSTPPSGKPPASGQPNLPDAKSQTHDEPTQRQWYFLVNVPSATVDFWTLPKRDTGFGIAAGVLHQQWRFFVSATNWSSQQRTITDVETYSSYFKRKSFEIWGCRGWGSGAFELAPCVVTAMDLVTASASSARLNASEQRVAIFSAGAGMSAYAHLAPWFSLYLATTGRIVANRRQFLVKEISGDFPTHTIPVGAWLTSIGSEWIF